MKERVKTLIPAEEIQKRLDELVVEIEKDFAGNVITLICVLKGGVIFMVDLAKKLRHPVEFDFLEISSYGNETVSSGHIKINKDLQNPITGKHVLLVEDIIDSGHTLKKLVNHLSLQNPASLKICTLLDKPDRRAVEGVHVDYTGFVIPNEFVVGYGLDYMQLYRNLPFIGVMEFYEDEQ